VRCVCGINIEKKKWIAQWVPAEFVDEHLGSHLLCIYACPVCGTLKVDYKGGPKDSPENNTRM
jgi:hypothetical protein